MIRAATIIGMGRVGGAMATRLQQRGVRVHGVSHAEFADWLTSHAPIGDVLVIAVKDAAMDDVVRAIAHSHHALIGVIALHVNGSLRPWVLHPLTEIGASIASAHPFQTFGDADPSALDAIGWGVECTDDDWPTLDAMIHTTGGVPVRLMDMTDERKRIYHAAAVAASNFTYAAYQLGRDLATAAGIPPDIMLAPIMHRTLHNAVDALQHDLPFAMTGPIVRGDVDGVRRQFGAIPEASRDVYRQLGLALIEVVRDRHTTAVIDAMREALRAH